MSNAWIGRMMELLHAFGRLVAVIARYRVMVVQRDYARWRVRRLESQLRRLRDD